MCYNETERSKGGFTMKEKSREFWEKHGDKVKFSGVVIGVGAGIAAVLYYGQLYKVEALVELEDMIEAGTVVANTID